MKRDALVRRIRELSQPIQPVRTDLEPRLGVLRDLRSIVFDVYGTLFVSGSGDLGVSRADPRPDALLQAFGAAGFAGQLETAAKHGVAFLYKRIEAVHAESKAEGCDDPEVEIRAVWDHVLGGLHADGWITPAPTPHCRDRVAVEYECRVNPVWPMPGALDLVRDLRRRGIPLGIASNAQFYTPLLFPALMGAEPDELGFQPNLSVFSYEHRIAKPSPGVFGILADRLRRLGLAPSQTLYVGNDMLNDVTPASREGFRTALFAGDARSLRLRADDPRCQGVRPDRVVIELGQIREALPA